VVAILVNYTYRQVHFSGGDTKQKKKMKISLVEKILFVSDLKRCRDFYKSLLLVDPVTDVLGMVEFKLAKCFILGLMPLEGISRILGPETIKPTEMGIPPRSELYLMVDNPDEMFSRALSLGATVLSPVQERNWGHRVGYVADLEGNVLGFARQIT